jgi:hypothetical protein
LNKATGATQAIRIKITPGNAVPMACSVLLARPLATPVVICTPTPSTSTISTGVNAAARNQCRLFQNQDRPASETSPAAATGVTAASTIKAALRVIMTSS